MKNKPKQKIYCYIDETGQDSGSDYYITVVVVSAKNQEEFRSKLELIEKESRVGAKKWRRANKEQNSDFLNKSSREFSEYCKIYFNQYKKPTNFSVATAEIINDAIKDFISNIKSKYEAIIYVDGINKTKAQSLTTRLRSQGIFLKYVKTARDESNPCIRFADRWAGCIRGAKEENIAFWRKIVERAKKLKILKSL